MAEEGLIRANTIVEDLQAFVSKVHDHFDHSTSNINWKITDRRSLSANSQVWVWAKQIAESQGEDVKTAYARMKRDHGLPIILSDTEHGPLVDWMLKQFRFYQRTDDQQLKIIDAIEITRKFSTRQHNNFRDSVQAFYNANGFNLQYMDKE
jgi:hypothetical protein